MVMSVKSTLEMNGYAVQTAGDGVQALAKLKTGFKPNLIITDINMPNMGGLELIKNVKALPGYKFVPILTLTTESDSGKRDEGKRLGAAGWLVKPISGADLLKVLKQLLP
jgi:two-component system chemotaxis response regulator CheY